MTDGRPLHSACNYNRQGSSTRCWSAGQQPKSPAGKARSGAATGLDQSDAVGQTIGLDDEAGVMDDLRSVQTVHMFGSGARCEHGEDAGAAAHVQDHLPWAAANTHPTDRAC